MATNSRIKPVERATKITWSDWVDFMDSIGAKNLGHHDIALKVYEKLDGTIESVGWWAQAVTVAYEQYIGRRIPGQRPDGTFQTSVSRATGLPMAELMDRWVDFAASHQRIREVISGDLKVSGTGKRITWRTKAVDGSAIVVTSEPKSNGTASVTATQMGLQTLDLNEQAKAGWLTILEEFLSTLE